MGTDTDGAEAGRQHAAKRRRFWYGGAAIAALIVIAKFAPSATNDLPGAAALARAQADYDAKSRAIMDQLTKGSNRADSSVGSAATDDVLTLPFDALLSRAKAGDARAANEVGWRFQHGTDVAQDPAAAVKWYTLAADAGLSDAQVNLAYMSEQGLGTARNFSRARALLEAALRQHNPHAANNLGTMYANGEGVARDLGLARKYFQLALVWGDENGGYNANAAQALLQQQQAQREDQETRQQQAAGRARFDYYDACRSSLVGCGPIHSKYKDN